MKLKPGRQQELPVESQNPKIDKISASESVPDKYSGNDFVVSLQGILHEQMDAVYDVSKIGEYDESVEAVEELKRQFGPINRDFIKYFLNLLKLRVKEHSGTVVDVNEYVEVLLDALIKCFNDLKGINNSELIEQIKRKVNAKLEAYNEGEFFVNNTIDDHVKLLTLFSMINEIVVGNFFASVCSSLVFVLFDSIKKKNSKEAFEKNIEDYLASPVQQKIVGVSGMDLSFFLSFKDRLKYWAVFAAIIAKTLGPVDNAGKDLLNMVEYEGASIEGSGSDYESSENFFNDYLLFISDVLEKLLLSLIFVKMISTSLHSFFRRRFLYNKLLFEVSSSEIINNEAINSIEKLLKEVKREISDLKRRKRYGDLSPMFEKIENGLKDIYDGLKDESDVKEIIKSARRALSQAREYLSSKKRMDVSKLVVPHQQSSSKIRSRFLNREERKEFHTLQKEDFAKRHQELIARAQSKSVIVEEESESFEAEKEPEVYKVLDKIYFNVKLKKQEYILFLNRLGFIKVPGEGKGSHQKYRKEESYGTFNVLLSDKFNNFDNKIIKKDLAELCNKGGDEICLFVYKTYCDLFGDARSISSYDKILEEMSSL